MKRRGEYESQQGMGTILPYIDVQEIVSFFFPVTCLPNTCSNLTYINFTKFVMEPGLCDEAQGSGRLGPG
jgi:hypothetical protein